MAEYLPVRAVNRSPSIRINKTRITSTATYYVDVSDAVQRKELAHHFSIGQLFPVGPLTATNSDAVVLSGMVTDQGASGADMVVTTTAGSFKNRQTGAVISTVSTDSTLATADATNPRIDIIQLKTADGTVSKVTGTAAASPVAKPAETGNIVLAEVSVPANDTAITTNQVTDKRPFA